MMTHLDRWPIFGVYLIGMMVGYCIRSLQIRRVHLFYVTLILISCMYAYRYGHDDGICKTERISRARAPSYLVPNRPGDGWISQ